MHRTRRAGRTALAAAIALGVVAVPAAALTAPARVSAEVTPTALSSADDSLILSTDSSTGTVTWNGQTQLFSGGQQCEIIPAGGAPDLLSLRGLVGNDADAIAGFRNGDIGVFEFTGSSSPNNAAQCSQVDAGSFTSAETLRLELGAVLTEADVVATSVDLSLIAQSRDGSISVTLLGADGSEYSLSDPITWKRLKSGTLIDTPSPVKAPGFVPIIGVELKATAGNFSLRGATFDMADGTLDCDEDTTLVVEGLGSVKLTRLGNAGGADCTAIPYSLRYSTADQAVRFLKSLEEQTSAQFILDFDWKVSPANTGDLSQPLLETKIDYEQGTEPNEIPLRWCPDVQADGTPVVTTDMDQETLLDGTQFTCILSQNAKVVDGGADPEGGPDPADYVTVQQSVYLLGDAAYRFR